MFTVFNLRKKKCEIAFYVVESEVTLLPMWLFCPFSIKIICYHYSLFTPPERSDSRHKLVVGIESCQNQRWVLYAAWLKWVCSQKIFCQRQQENNSTFLNK